MPTPNSKLQTPNSKLQTPNQSGIAQILVVVLLLAGIVLATYLVQQKTHILPFANEPISSPITKNPFGKAVIIDSPSGYSSYISVVNSSNINPKLGFTVEAWVKPSDSKYDSSVDELFNSTIIAKNTAYSNPFKLKVANWYPPNTTDITVYYQFLVDDSALGCVNNSTNVSMKAALFSKTVPISEINTKIKTWTHIAGVIQQDGQLEIYVNGQKGERIGKIKNLCQNNQLVFVGHGGQLGSPAALSIDQFYGQIDEIRISDVARYSNTYNVPSAPFVNDGNTQMLWHLNGNFDDSSGKGYNGEIVRYADFVDSTIPVPTPSPVPDKDSDGDHWSDKQEAFIGTDPYSPCPGKKKLNAWPPDINNNGIVNQSDYKKVQNDIRKKQYNRRLDLTANGKLNQDDLDTLKKYLGQKCTGAKGSAGLDFGDSGN